MIMNHQSQHSHLESVNEQYVLPAIIVVLVLAVMQVVQIFILACEVYCLLIAYCVFDILRVALFILVIFSETWVGIGFTIAHAVLLVLMIMFTIDVSKTRQLAGQDGARRNFPLYSQPIYHQPQQHVQFADQVAVQPQFAVLHPSQHAVSVPNRS